MDGLAVARGRVWVAGWAWSAWQSFLSVKHALPESKTRPYLGVGRGPPSEMRPSPPRVGARRNRKPPNTVNPHAVPCSDRDGPQPIHRVHVPRPPPTRFQRVGISPGVEFIRSRYRPGWRVRWHSRIRGGGRTLTAIRGRLSPGNHRRVWSVDGRGCGGTGAGTAERDAPLPTTCRGTAEP